MVYGLRFMVYGLWFKVYGLWFKVYGLWVMVYGLWAPQFLISIISWTSLTLSLDFSRLRNIVEQEPFKLLNF